MSDKTAVQSGLPEV